MLTPGRYYPGSPIRFTISFTDDDGVGVDPATVTVKTISPTGTVSTYVYGTDDEVARSSAGNYYADITPDTGGRWSLRWQTTGTSTTFATEEDFLVQLSPFVDPITPPPYSRRYW